MLNLLKNSKNNPHSLAKPTSGFYKKMIDVNVTNQLISGQTFDIASFDRTLVQRLDNYNEQYTFDFLDSVTKAFPASDIFPLIILAPKYNDVLLEIRLIN